MIVSGGVSLLDSALNAEMNISILNKVLEKVLQFLPQGAITDADMDIIRQAALSELQQKYPQAGIKHTP
jgi:hypothetical protein